MRNALRAALPAAAAVYALAIAAPSAPSASLSTKILKGAAIGYAVTRTAGPLDSFINKVTLRHNVKSSMATKVVPILSVGEKGYVGGAQVSGPRASVGGVKAVFQYEKNFSTGNYRAKVLIPSASLNPLKLERVPKVGVTAIIDVALSGRLRSQTVGTGIHAGDVIRGTAVLVAVKNLDDKINKGLNAITFNKGSVTKVVPMGSIGEKAYVGAAQVAASSGAIGKVNAVWQYEDLFNDGRFRVKVLVPTTSSNPLKMKRVDGAGLTAIVDMALSRQVAVRSGGKRRSTPSVVVIDREKAPVRQDRGKHKGWYIGKHKGWSK